jgi:hypothetical protein
MSGAPSLSPSACVTPCVRSQHGGVSARLAAHRTGARPMPSDARRAGGLCSSRRLCGPCACAARRSSLGTAAWPQVAWCMTRAGSGRRDLRARRASPPARNCALCGRFAPAAVISMAAARARARRMRRGCSELAPDTAVRLDSNGRFDPAAPPQDRKRRRVRPREGTAHMQPSPNPRATTAAARPATRPQTQRPRRPARP